MPFQLTITEGKGQGQTFYFDRDMVKIGRLPDNDLVLYDTGVSRYHCEIIHEDGGYTLRDAGSSNGTLLNDVITTEGRVSNGDHIGVGPITFTFAESQAPATAESKRRQSLAAPQNSAARKALEEDSTVAWGKNHPAARSALRAPTEPVAVSVSRTATGSFVSYHQQMTGKWRALPRSTRLAMVGATATIVTGLVVSAYIIQSTPPPDRSTEIFPASSDTAILRFGAGNVDVHTPHQANFSFDYEGGRVVVRYAAGSIDSGQEIEVLLNNQSVGFVPAASKWTKGLELTLPRSALQPGRNILTFDNTLPRERKNRWAISQLNISQSPLPSPDPVKAEEQLELAKAAFDTRSVAPQNLYKALEYYNKAALLLEALDEKPPLWEQIQEGRKEAEAELERVHMTHLFTAQKAQRFGNMAEAADSLRSLLRYYPNPDDRRHQEVQKRLGQVLAGDGP